MAQLKEVFVRLGFTNITTLLNSGNVVFFGPNQPTTTIEKTIATALEDEFSFSIPVFIFRGDALVELDESKIFGSADPPKSIKRYVTFLISEPRGDSRPPKASCAEGFSIVQVQGKMVFSTVDSSSAETIGAMKVLEQFYGKEVTTRNWNTVKKLQKILAE